MKISVFGLGYVGIVSAACLANEGHHIIGVDISKEKVDQLNSGKAPIIEEMISEMVQDGVQSGKLRATTNAREAIENSELALVCVGTPSLPNGKIDTRYVKKVTIEIGELIKLRKRPFLFVLRSTVLPGTIEAIVIPELERSSNRKVGDGFDVLFHPEFLREGTAVKDYYDPPKIVVGERESKVAQQIFDLYEGIEAPRFVTSIEVAEMVKYADNAFHAVKITFANEIGRFCEAHGTDSREVMDLFCADTKLNISTKYLRPGFAFGGSCLPKDLRALLSESGSRGTSLPMLEGVLRSNKIHVEQALKIIIKKGGKKIGFVGLSFKPGTDDLRESPLVDLAEHLIGKGKDLKIFDNNVRNAWLVGSNKAYIDKHIPHLAQLLIESEDLLGDCDTIVIGHPVDNVLLQNWLKLGINILDLDGSGYGSTHPKYQGFVW